MIFYQQLHVQQRIKTICKDNNEFYCSKQQNICQIIILAVVLRFFSKDCKETHFANFPFDISKYLNILFFNLLLYHRQHSAIEFT